MDIIKTLRECTKNGIQIIDIDFGCAIIQQYIKDTKDIDIILDANSIDNMISMQLYQIALNSAIKYYTEINKK